MTELEEIRNRLGWSQAQMGERIGMHRNSIANAEKRGGEDKTTWLAARMVALEEASERGTLDVVHPLDLKLIEKLAGVMLRTREIRFADPVDDSRLHPSLRKIK